MNDGAETKLSELRSRTDRQLVSLIGSRLDRGLMFAQLLADEDESQGPWGAPEELLARAEQAHTEASLWLPLLSGITQLERRRMELRLSQLRGLLDHAANHDVRVQTACS